MPKSFIKCEAFYNSLPVKEIVTLLEQKQLSYRLIAEKLGVKSIRHVQLVAIKYGLCKQKNKASEESAEVVTRNVNLEPDSFLLNSY